MDDRPTRLKKTYCKGKESCDEDAVEVGAGGAGEVYSYYRGSLYSLLLTLPHGQTTCFPTCHVFLINGECHAAEMVGNDVHR